MILCDSKIRKRGTAILALMFCLVLAYPFARASPQKRSTAQRPAPAPPKNAAGRQTYQSKCAGCHGLDGRGGDRAPNIATDAKVQQRSDADLLKIIRQGVPRAGMPAFPSLDPRTSQELLRFLRSLQGQVRELTVPGNPARGEELFFSSARCTECHMLRGKGGFIAADLTAYSQTRAAEQIRQAIVAPDVGPNGMVTVRTRDGKTYSGILRNEDNFSLQMQTLDGAFLFWNKAGLEEVIRATGSMHGDLGQRLSAEQIRDLVCYLVRVGGPPQKLKEYDSDE